jgi:hypothetical protein
VVPPVGQKKANELGLYDMSGNVWEFTQDYYDEDYYSISPVYNPCNTTESYAFTMRGGGAWNFNRLCRVSMRADQVLYNDQTPVDSNWDMGLRLVLKNTSLSCPDNNHPHMIDLGLPSGTMWACCNVGATKPEDYGDYFAWGETLPKEVYNSSTYIHCDGSEYTCHDIGTDIAGTVYDAATGNWGAPWRMPTLAQCVELRDNCTSEWTTQNGINGIKFTGPNGGTIFLPAAGYRLNSSLGYGGSSGYYWSSTLHGNLPNNAYGLDFGSGTVTWDRSWRSYGLSVRPVRQN